ncbi:MAG: nucleotidyltransferase domain-containing protein [Elusimicrobia bacterium]|nr:nucleotidyltransferase domain-containing protein [Elusimicrobiota bacterium]
MGSRLPFAGILKDGSQARILRFLIDSRAEWSGREISRQVGLSAPACHEALKKLYARGLVLFRRVSNVHLYKANAENYLVEHVFAPYFEAARSIPGEISKLVKRTLLEEPAGAAILSLVAFGSMARDRGDLGSDLDLLVVVSSESDRKALEPNLDKLRRVLARRFSIPFSPYVQTLEEFRRKHRNGLPLIKSILDEGRSLHGKEPKELIS